MTYVEEITDKLSLKPPRGRMTEIGPGVPPYQYPDYFVGYYGMTQVSEKDIWNLRKFMLSLYESPEPHEGEWVRFANGAMVRVTYVWRFCSNENTPCDSHDHIPRTVQTYPGGHFHIGDGYVSHSGSLDPGANYNTFSLTNELKLGSAWIWHNNSAGASRGVDCAVSFRVWQSTAIPREYEPCEDCGCFRTLHSFAGSHYPYCDKHNRKCSPSTI